MLHALLLAAGADGLVEGVVEAGGAEGLAIRLAEAGDGGLVEDHLGDGGELDPADLLDGALGLGVEAARVVERVAEKIEAHRRVGARRVDVDHAAADGVVAGLGHRGGAVEAHPPEVFAQGVEIERLAHLGHEGGGAHGFPRGHPLGGGVERGQHHRPAGQPVGERGQRRHAGSRNVGVGADPVVGQAVPGGEAPDRDLGREEGQRLGERSQPRVVARHVDHRPVGFRHEVREQLRVEALGGAAGQDRAVGEGGLVRHLRGDSAGAPAAQAFAQRSGGDRRCGGATPSPAPGAAGCPHTGNNSCPFAGLGAGTSRDHVGTDAAAPLPRRRPRDRRTRR